MWPEPQQQSCERMPVFCLQQAVVLFLLALQQRSRNMGLTARQALGERGPMIDVLVVDDDFRVAEINAKYVGKVPGFRVAARAHSAAQALAAVERGAIDLVLLDHYLPDQTGLELVHRMREQGHGPDVIMITAASDVTTVQKAMRLGALHSLVKPFTFAALRSRLDSYAALRRTVDRVGGRGLTGQEQVDRIF